MHKANNCCPPLVWETAACLTSCPQNFSSRLRPFVTTPGNAMIATSALLTVLAGVYIGLARGNIVPGGVFEAAAFGVVGSNLVHFGLGIAQKCACPPLRVFGSGYDEIPTADGGVNG